MLCCGLLTSVLPVLQLACMLSSSLFDWIALTASVAISTRLITANTLPVVVSTLPTLGRLAVGVLAGGQRVVRRKYQTSAVAVDDLRRRRRVASVERVSLEIIFAGAGDAAGDVRFVTGLRRVGRQ